MATNSKYPPEEDYPDTSKNYTYMAKYLTKDMYSRLRDVKSEGGFTFDQVIQTGVDNPKKPGDVSIGCVSGDEDSYKTFGELLDQVICIVHNGYTKDQKHKTDLNPDSLKGDGNLDSNYVMSTRIRTGRSIRGFNLAPLISRAGRRRVEKIISDATATFTGDLKGTYHRVSEMTKEEEQKLIDDHYLFANSQHSSYYNTSGMARDWPDARGIWFNDKKTFLVWVNEEDHSRIIAMQEGGNMKEVFTRFCKGLKLFEDAIQSAGYEFMWNDHLGFILTCPSNVGTGMRASVHMKIPNVSKDSRFKEMLVKLRLQKRGLGGEETESVNGMFDISNLDRLGYSEVEIVQKVMDGVELLIKMEKRLEAGESIDDIIPQ